MTVEQEQWPTFHSFVAAWLVNSLLVWGIAVVIALAFMPGRFHSGLVPGSILLALAGIPICSCTLVVQGLLLVVGKLLLHASSRFCKLLTVIGTVPVTVLVVWLTTLALGGVDFFIPRI